MAELRVPRLNANDAEYTLLDWLVGDGEPVTAGQPVVTVETAKAVEELASGDDGVLCHLVPARARCAPGDVLGHVLAPGESRPSRAVTQAAEPTPTPGPGGPVVTAPARALLDELGIDPERVRELGLPVVRRADVERLAGVDTVTLSPGQRAVARTVTESHRTIPAAYTVVKVDVGAALARARALTRRLRTLVGLPELVVAALGGLAERFPRCFATRVDDRTVRLAGAVHVGVTVDAGNGLFVPVLRDVAGLGIDELVAAYARHRRTAAAGTFREEDLAGATITLTLHHDGHVLLAIPLVRPGQTCALALAAPQPELVLAPDGTVTTRTVVLVGLAYDHRVVNGRDAALFLEALRESLETGEEAG